MAMKLELVMDAEYIYKTKLDFLVWNICNVQKQPNKFYIRSEGAV
jgi:hypothetical protein